MTTIKLIKHGDEDVGGFLRRIGGNVRAADQIRRNPVDRRTTDACDGIGRDS